MLNSLNLRRAALAAATALALVMALALAACNKEKTAGDVMAEVNGKKILRSEVDKYYANQTAGTPQPPAAEQAQSLRLSILRELIDNEIMMQRAEKLGLLATDEEVEAKFNEIKSPYTQEDFDKRLKTRNITVEDFKRDLRRSLTVDKVLNKEIKSKINISDTDVKAYYDAHKAEFNLVEPQYHLQQIVVTFHPDPRVRNLKNSKAQNEAEAKRKIQELVNRLESGEDFATVAMNWSEDPQTASNGGDMGYMPESALKGNPDTTTRSAVLSLKPGQVSSVLPAVDANTRQSYGYRIVRLESKETAGQRELSDPRVLQSIREQLRGRREQLLKEAYYEAVRDDAKIENYYAEQILKDSGK
ncbi:MAG: SurA N-terminal domain-containing protein [Candidatus Koribacter versatilis]|uniref:SurA N-terminal domain-containing protein n=1 Tax=Candidatus Korobacter versatilis TaxID=658062 RepID=A0A932EPF1_9BACT|nr:SurA N-terminal domain-containing protein [Candidatus Koribacter versatilis]